MELDSKTMAFFFKCLNTKFILRNWNVLYISVFPCVSQRKMKFRTLRKIKWKQLSINFNWQNCGTDLKQITWMKTPD